MSDTQKDWVWVVAGGPQQCALIKAIKDRGYNVLVTDRNTQAPGSLLADYVVEMDTYDVDGHIQVAQSLQIKPVAVLTAGADVGPTVSAVAEVLNLPAERADVAARCRNKYEMRRTLNLPHPVYLSIEANADTAHTLWKAKCAINGINPYPCVVKPFEGSGSRGVSVVRSPWDWMVAIKKAAKVDNRRHRQILIEEYLRGPEVSMDFFAYNGKLHFANAAWRLFDKNRAGIELGHINPWQPPREVIQMARSAAESLGVTFGPFKIDFIHDHGYGWIVMETATRLSGGFDHWLTSPLATGRDITGAMIDLALGLPLDKRKIKIQKEGAAVAYAPIFKPGKIKKWNIPAGLPGVKQVHVLAEKEIEPIENCTQRPLFIITTGQTATGALKNALRAAQKIEVEYV